MSGVIHTVCMLASILCFLHIKDTAAVLCFHCNSEYDPRCGDPFDPYSLGRVNCSMQEGLEHLPNLIPSLCRKTTQKVYGKTRVVRGCGYVTDDRDDHECMKRSGTHDVQAIYCACSSDFCNGSKAMLLAAPKHFIIILLLSASFIAALSL